MCAKFYRDRQHLKPKKGLLASSDKGNTKDHFVEPTTQLRFDLHQKVQRLLQRVDVFAQLRVQLCVKSLRNRNQLAQ